jgi:hypothetical protein
MLSSPFSIKRKSVIVTLITTYMIVMFIQGTKLEAQNTTNTSTGETQPSTTLVCDTDVIGNDNISSSDIENFSSTDAVIDIRCHLLEARQSIAADASDSAVLQINEAEETLLAYFNTSSNSSS